MAERMNIARHLIVLAPFALAACGSNEGQNTQTAMLPPENEQAAMPAEGPVPAEAMANMSANTTDTDAEADRFAGRWTGPEGLFAQIAPAAAAGRYTVEMQYTLDDRGTFPARLEGDALILDRAGRRIALTPGTGDETGMKWLAGKRDCLVAIAGSEGYCRD